MIKVVLILFLAGQPEPNISLKNDTSFETEAACKAALPAFAAEFVTKSQEKGFTWGDDFMFALKCTKPSKDGSI